MHLELTSEQAAELREALHDHRDSLEYEVSRTEKVEARRLLRHKADVLDAIVRQLDASANQGSAYA